MRELHALNESSPPQECPGERLIGPMKVWLGKSSRRLYIGELCDRLLEVIPAEQLVSAISEAAGEGRPGVTERDALIERNFVARLQAVLDRTDFLKGKA